MSEKTRRMAQIALMTAVLCVVAPFTIPVGPIPFSLAVFVLFLVGALLPPLQALFSVAVYLLIGMVGLPVFSAFRGGPQVLLGPTGGYLLGYLVLVLCTACGVKYGKKYVLQLLAALIGLAGCYAVGTIWFMVATSSSVQAALVACVLPFAVPDTIKAVLALALAKAVRIRMARDKA